MSLSTRYVDKLKGTRILIIGGTSGIGFAVAEAAIANGAGQVIISSSNPARVDSAVHRLRTAYPSSTISGQVCDLGDEAKLENNIAALFDSISELDHIVFTAGDALANSAMGSIQDLTTESLRRAGVVRFMAPFFVAKHGVRKLANPDTPASSITITIGASTQKPLPNYTVPAAYLSGVNGMMINLALELRPVRVNLVSPGAVDTEMWDQLGQERKKETMEKMERMTTTGRVGSPYDVAEAYLYCMRDWNVTGTTISTNGGALLT